MTYLLQFCGVSDPLQMFYLEQSSVSQGPAFAGFRPFRLDALLDWAVDTAQGRGWDLDLIHSTVMDVWLERSEAIRQWQLQLVAEPDDRRLVAALGTKHDWEQRCEAMLLA